MGLADSLPNKNRMIPVVDNRPESKLSTCGAFLVLPLVRSPPRPPRGCDRGRRVKGSQGSIGPASATKSVPGHTMDYGLVYY